MYIRPSVIYREPYYGRFSTYHIPIPYELKSGNINELFPYKKV